MEARKIKIGLIQMKMDDKRSDNYSKVRRLVSEAVDLGARIIILPELFNIPYIAQYSNFPKLHYAEPIPGQTSSFLSELAKEYNISIVGGSIYERTSNNHYYNTALIIDNSIIC